MLPYKNCICGAHHQQEWGGAHHGVQSIKDSIWFPRGHWHFLWTSWTLGSEVLLGEFDKAAKAWKCLSRCNIQFVSYVSSFVSRNCTLILFQNSLTIWSNGRTWLHSITTSRNWFNWHTTKQFSICVFNFKYEQHTFNSMSFLPLGAGTSSAPSKVKGFADITIGNSGSVLAKILPSPPLLLSSNIVQFFWFGCLINYELILF